MPFDLDRVAERFDLGIDAVLDGRSDRGEQGMVCKVVSARGTFAVKTMFEAWSEAEVAGPATYQQLVHAAGVNVPGIVRTIDGTVLADIDGATVRVYEWVELRERDPLLDPVAVGTTAAAIHRVRWVKGTEVHPWYTEAVGAARWSELRDAAADAHAPFDTDLARLHDGLIALESLLEVPTDLQTCHCDLWADNLLATSNGELCVIDWENAGPADPSQELCLLLYEFGGNDASRCRALYDAYVAAGGPGRVDRPGNFSTVIAQVCHINELAVSRWLGEGSTAAQRAHDASLFGEFVDQPLTLGLIDDILAAIHP